MLDNPLVGVAGCLPPDMLGLLADERGREDGFVHRLLFACPDPVALQWTEAVVSDAALEGYCQVVDGLWALPGGGARSRAPRRGSRMPDGGDQSDQAPLLTRRHRAGRLEREGAGAAATMRAIAAGNVSHRQCAPANADWR